MRVAAGSCAGGLGFDFIRAAGAGLARVDLATCGFCFIFVVVVVATDGTTAVDDVRSAAAESVAVVNVAASNSAAGAIKRENISISWGRTALGLAGWKPEAGR